MRQRGWPQTRQLLWLVIQFEANRLSWKNSCCILNNFAEFVYIHHDSDIYAKKKKKLKFIDSQSRVDEAGSSAFHVTVIISRVGWTNMLTRHCDSKQYDNIHSIQYILCVNTSLLCLMWSNSRETELFVIWLDHAHAICSGAFIVIRSKTLISHEGVVDAGRLSLCR